MDELEVVENIPVYQSSSDNGEIYVLQYPTQTGKSNFSSNDIIQSRLKPANQQLELVQRIDSADDTYYDPSVGEHIAVSSDGMFRDHLDPKDKQFSNNTMDKKVLKSGPKQRDVGRYVIGKLIAGRGMVFTPVSVLLEMRPVLNYIDNAETRVKNEKKAEDAQDEAEEETDRPVTVKFARTENDRIKNARKRSYNYQQSRIEDEKWSEMKYFPMGHKYGEEMKERTFETGGCEPIGDCYLPPSHFLSLLALPSSTTPSGDTSQHQPADASITASTTTATVKEDSRDMPETHLHSFKLETQVEYFMRKVEIARLSEILQSLDNSPDQRDNLKEKVAAVQHSATLVQGCWVLKSLLLYPVPSTNNKSEKAAKKCNRRTRTKSGTPYKDMVEVRDYVLYFLAEHGYIERKQLSVDSGCVPKKLHDSLSVMPGDDIAKILVGVALPEGDSRWSFKLPTDQHFIDKYKQITEQYRMRRKVYESGFVR